MTEPKPNPSSDSGLPVFRWALLAVALIILIVFGYCASRTIPAFVDFGRERTTITHDLVVDRMRTVAKLVSSETTVRDVVIYQNTWLGSTKRTLVVVTGRLLAGINLEANPSVRIDSRTKRIAIELPPAELLGVEVLDLKTYDERAGLWNPFTPADRDSVQRQVRAQLIKAGSETELLDHANRSAVELLRTLLAQDGYTVDVSIRGQPKPSGVDQAIAPAASASRDVGGCPHTGRWAICNLETRLRQAGFVAKRISGDSAKSARFSVTPIVYTLGRARLEVYLYDDSTVLAREIAAMDTVGPPLVIRSGNLAAVYIGDNGQQAERLALAITAGAPQPGSPR